MTFLVSQSYVSSGINSVTENVHSIHYFQFNNLQCQTLHTHHRCNTNSKKRLDSSLLVELGGKEEFFVWIRIPDNSPNPFPLHFLLCGCHFRLCWGQWSQVRMNGIFLPKDGIMFSIGRAGFKADLFVGWSRVLWKTYPSPQAYLVAIFLIWTVTLLIIYRFCLLPQMTRFLSSPHAALLGRIL